jgi:4,5:9,10-diseco-3-hydroxy-5,9,17-trioxoandrosta-1(10),2-diene-4-oate hydrolase
MGIGRRVDLGDASMVIDDHAGDGTPILLLHGWLRNRHSWRGFAPVLARHTRVIVPDLPGFGASDIPTARYDVGFFVDAVRKLLDRIGVARVRVVGHGLGGAIALALAIDHPEHVERVVVASPSWTQNVLLGLRARWLTSGPWGRVAFELGLSRGRVRRMLETRHFQEAELVDDALLDAVWAPLLRSRSRLAAWRSLATDLDPGLTERVARLTVPTVAVWGYNDRVHPLDLARRLEAAAPAVKLTMIPNCGHAVHETRPRSFAVYLGRHFDIPIDPYLLDDGHPKPRELL